MKLINSQQRGDGIIYVFTYEIIKLSKYSNETNYYYTQGLGP